MLYQTILKLQLFLISKEDLKFGIGTIHKDGLLAMEMDPYMITTIHQQ